MPAENKWEKKEIPPELVKNLAARYGCDQLTAAILIRRGITKGADICYFLEDDLRYLHNPFELPGMEDAVERILAAVEEGEKVLVFGDRDVDGISGTALLSEYLEALGMDISWRVPTGDETYGLSDTVIDEFAADSGTLIITVDCGISNLAEVKKANSLGIDVIITDHHNPQEELPEAYVIINPKLAGSLYPFRDLAGCAVAYKLVSALRFANKSSLYGQSVCLLNTRPVNESWIIEIAKLRNMVRVANLTETIAIDPGTGRSVVSISNTRLPAFLEGQQILAWDAGLQKRTLTSLFGNSAEINMLDIAPEIAKEIPSVAGKSLLRICELSRIAKYNESETGELDAFISLFNSFLRKKEKLAEDDPADLQLACLGTIADVMPLRDENRIIVRSGLKSMAEHPRPGLAELFYKMDLMGRRLSTNEISWQISPAINSAGRMGNPRKAASLLLDKDADIRDSLALELIAMNDERKKLGAEIWTIVEPQAEESLAIYNNNLSIAYSEKIPRGVTGIMANRMIGRFKVPSMAASIGGEIITGSLRSVRGYDLRFLLEPCADLFLDWGGHDFAAGFSMEKKNWDAFLERVKKSSLTIELESPDDETLINVDAELPMSFMNPDLLNIIDRFEPYGEGNDPLIFMARGVRIEAINRVGKSEARHVKLTLDTGKFKWPAVYWQAASKVKTEFDLEDRVDLCFRVSRNWYNGNETPQLIINDLRRSK